MLTQLNFPLDRIRWACRRGMLELDKLLLPFCNEAYSTLTIEQQKSFLALLEQNDQDLYRWLLYEEPPTEFQEICACIRAFHQRDCS